MSAVADVLSRAADLIERHGWRGPGDLSGFIDHLAPVTYQWAVDILQDHLGERMRVRQAEQRAEQAEAERDALRVALARHGRHDDYRCARGCVCGFTAALRGEEPTDA